jgi:elongation factor 1-gamma
VPNFVSTDKSMKLQDANAIAYYLATDELRGTKLEDSTRVLDWMSFGSSEVASAVVSWVYPALSLVESTPALIARATADLKKVFSFLNEHLKTRTFLASERITVADIAVAADLLLAYQHVADEAFRKPYDNVNRWFLTVINQKQFKDVVGEVTLCSKAAVFNGNFSFYFSSNYFSLVLSLMM